jgi:hypothetical protein
MKHSEMNDSTIELGLTKEEMMPILEASDEALEIAASSAEEKANYTLGACTGLSVCPG